MRMRRSIPCLGLFAGLIITNGCASPVPDQPGSSSKRLVVTLVFNDIPDPYNDYYYFAINYARDSTGYGPGNANAHGPVAIFGPSVAAGGGYGNGFATGSQSGQTAPAGAPVDYGLTDYVVFHSGGQPSNSNIGVYHIDSTTGPNTPGPYPGRYVGQPAQFIPPADPTAAMDASVKTVQFQLDVGQLVDPNNQLSQTQRSQLVGQLRYLQINIIATNAVPVDQTFSGIKDVDSLGDTRNPSDQSSYLTIDLSQNSTYVSTVAYGPTLSAEPVGDVVPTGTDYSVDLASWSIQVVNTGG